MGFFSWRTQDTLRSINNKYCEDMDTFEVIMTDDKGNKWVENDYEGYGEFGGKDYYELLAEMNGKTTREEGISMAFDREMKDEVIFPSLSECGKYYNGSEPENCEYQGYFYPEEYEYN